jgi:predicted MFS family arabinose efflux permease
VRTGLGVPAKLRPPQRTGVLLSATLVLSIGKGTFLFTVLVYLLQVAKLDTLAATTALTLWGTASAAVAIPVGRLIDRARGRQAGAISACCVAVLIPLTAQLQTPWALMLVLAAAGGLDSCGNVVRRALFAGATGDGVGALAWARTVSNIGFALGGLLSVVLLSANSEAAYEFAYLLIGGVYLLMAACFATTSLSMGTREKAATAGTPAPAKPRNVRSGVALAVATGILTVHATLLTTVLPLWITKHTSVPVPVIGWLITLNAVLTIVAQIPVSKLATTTARALRCFKASAVWTATCCVLLGLVGFLPAGSQVAVLVAATIALTAGELFEAAGEWGLSATLAASDEHGFYQSACVLGEATQSAVGPLLIGNMVNALPVLGWPLLIGIIGTGRYIAGFIHPPERHRAAPRMA